MSIDDKTLSERDRIIKLITAKVIDVCFDMKLFRNCVACDHFDNTSDMCKLYNAKPPARVVVKGCDKFSDEIPF